MTPSQILLATDLSPASWRAIPQAARLAWLGSGEVTVAWVGDADDASAESLAAVRESLEQMDVSARSEALRGAPVEALLALAKSRDADVLVTTKHGEHATGQALGSVTYELLRRSHVPVLVAHDPISYDEPPRARPARWRTIAVSTDFSSTSDAGVAATAALCRQVGAALHVVTTVVDPRCELEVDAEGVRWPELPEELGDWLDRSTRLLGELAARYPDIEVTTRAVAAHEPGAAIVAAGLEARADLIVVPAHGRGPLEAVLLGSTSERVLQLSPLPVLVLRGAILGQP